MLEEEYFAYTPFTVMADQESGKHWAGRPKVLERIERILRRFSRRNESSLDIIWANFGAGKSHTLYYLAHRIEEQDKKNICVVVELPEQIKNFRDLYQRIIRKLPFEVLAKTLVEVDNEDFPEELKRAALAVVTGGAKEKDFALQWLRGERPDLRQLRNLTGIGKRIENDTDAADILSAMLGGLNAGGFRLCLMLDEFQRIGKLSERIRSQITSILRSLLSKNPRNFALFLAISSVMERSALKMVPEELKTIMGMQKSVTLPEMDETEALEFALARLRHFRPAEYSEDEFAPFGEKVIIQAIKAISSADAASLIPRTILQTLGYLYDELPESGELLDTEVASEILEDLNWGSHAENG